MKKISCQFIFVLLIVSSCCFKISKTFALDELDGQIQVYMQQMINPNTIFLWFDKYVNRLSNIEKKVVVDVLNAQIYSNSEDEIDLSCNRLNQDGCLAIDKLQEITINSVPHISIMEKFNLSNLCARKYWKNSCIIFHAQLLKYLH